MRTFLKNILLVLLVIYSKNISAQTYFGLRWNSATSEEYFVKTDPYTGNDSTIATIPGVVVIDNAGTLNTDSSKFVFAGQDSINGVYRYYVIDVNTGATISKKPYHDFVNDIEYDPDSHNYYGLYWNEALSTEYFVSVNPYSGNNTIIDSITNVKYITGESFINTDSGKYILMGDTSIGGTDNYYTIDIATGNTVYTSPISEYASYVKYYPAAGKYYGVSYDDSLSVFFFVLVDPYSGTNTRISSIPGVVGITGGGVIDTENAKYIITGINYPGGPEQYYVLNILSGLVCSNSTCENRIENIQYYKNLTENSNESNQLVFYPNPMNNSSILMIDGKCEVIEMYDITGRSVRQYKNIQSTEVAIYKQDLSAGLYFVKLTYQDGKIQSGKLIIQ